MRILFSIIMSVVFVPPVIAEDMAQKRPNVTHWCNHGAPYPPPKTDLGHYDVRNIKTKQQSEKQIEKTSDDDAQGKNDGSVQR